MRNNAIYAACAVGLALVIQPISAVGKSTKTKTTTVNCEILGQTIGAALESASWDILNEIVFTGTCVENLDIRTGRIRIRGDGNNPMLEGRIDIVGALHIILENFQIAAAEKGIDARYGASVFLENMSVTGASDRNIHVRWNSNVILVNTDVLDAAVTNVAITDGASAGIFDGSVIGGAGQNNIDVNRADLVVHNSTVTGAGQFGIGLGMATARIEETDFVGNAGDAVHMTRSSGADLVNSNFDTTVTVREGSHARIGPGSVLNVTSGRALEVRRGSSARLWQDVSVSSTGGSEAIRVSTNSTLEQSQGQATVMGEIDIRENSFAKFRRMHVYGPVVVRYGGGLRIEQDGTVGGQHYEGDISMLVGALLYIDSQDGTVEVVGNIGCDFDTSRLVVSHPANLALTGSIVGCPGF